MVCSNINKTPKQLLRGGTERYKDEILTLLAWDFALLICRLVSDVSRIVGDLLITTYESQLIKKCQKRDVT
jgi:hypothetical protein